MASLMNNRHKKGTKIDITLADVTVFDLQFLKISTDPIGFHPILTLRISVFQKNFNLELLEII